MIIIYYLTPKAFQVLKLKIIVLVTTREPLKFEKANSEIEYVNPIRGK